MTTQLWHLSQRLGPTSINLSRCGLSDTTSQLQKRTNSIKTCSTSGALLSRPLTQTALLQHKHGLFSSTLPNRSATISPVGRNTVRNFSTESMLDFDFPEDSRASKTKSRHLSRFRKNKQSKGRAFKDPVGYAGMQYGLEAGLSAARAQRKAAKLKPKKFSGKVAMYYGNTSTEPDPIITEETLEHLPKPNTIRTVQSVRVTTSPYGPDPTNIIIDYVASAPRKLKKEELQRRLDTIYAPTRLDAPNPTASQNTDALEFSHQLEDDVELPHESDRALFDQSRSSARTPATKSPLPESKYTAEEEEDELYDDMDEEDLEALAPQKLHPDDDLEMMSETTREAVKKVRSVFNGSLRWYQPVPGELSEIFMHKQSKREDLPSQRTALTSANSTSVRTILGGTNSKQQQQHPPDQIGLPEILKDGKILSKKSKVQPRQFFDHNAIQQLASQDYVKAKRAGSEKTTALHEVIKLPQICVVGRSNVGKSSLLNSLMGSKFNKMKVSSKPGKTQMIQMLAVSDKLAVVDMPGYGYATATPQAKRAMEERIGEYLMTKLPKRVFILIDARRGLGNADIRLADSLDQLRIVYQVVLTKVDKVRKVEQLALTEQSVREWLRRRPCGMPEVLKTSSLDRSGIDQLRVTIYTACGFNL